MFRYNKHKNRNPPLLIALMVLSLSILSSPTGNYATPGYVCVKMYQTSKNI